jgi:hypothetical protein
VFTRILIGTALGVGGLLGAVAVVALPGLVYGAAVCGVLTGMLVSLRAGDTTSGAAATGVRPARRTGLVAGAGVTGGLLALIGLVLLLGAAAGSLLLVALVVLVVLGGMRARRRTRSPAASPADPWRAVLSGAHGAGPSRRVGSGRAARVVPPAPEAPAPSAAPDPADLTARQLCVLWQRTYFALLELPAGTSREGVAHLRERLLDEMERRDPDGFTRWLDAGPRAGSNPGRYLAGGR